MKFFTKSMARIVLLALVLGGFSFQAAAQRTVTGTVKDQETGEPLIGVTVLEKDNRANGTTTNVDGKFSIKVSASAAALTLSYTGYELLDVSIAGINAVDAQMATSAVLKEVVVIGYGTVKREDATGLVQSVSTDKFNKGAITGPQELLAGKISGVVIVGDPSPGGGAKIRIRGESSLSASNDPLVVIDGVPLDNGGVSGSRNFLNIVNPNDIESITVLKDASAAAIYGNRASAGVILITTKKGKLGKKISIGYNVNVSSAQTANRVDMLTADEFRQAVNDTYFVSDPTKPQHPAIGLVGTDDTDWQDEIYQTAVAQDHSLSVSGGVGVVPYRVSLGFTDKDGLLRTDNFKRYTTAVNLNPKFLDNRLQLNLSLRGMLNDNHFADRGAIGNALRIDPTRPVYEPGNAYGGYYSWLDNEGFPSALAPRNPVAILEQRDDNSTVKQYILNGSVDYRFAQLPALRLNLNLGYDHQHGEGRVVVPAHVAAFSFDKNTGGGTDNYYEQTKKNELLEAYANYKEDFGKHGIDAMAGYSWQHFEVGNYFLNSDAAHIDTSEGRDPAEFYLLSMFGRVNYSFDDRYLFTATLRRDGTSRFNPDYRWGLFPSLALGVKVLDNDERYLNHLKVRLSWGITGQQDIGDYYAYMARYQVGDFHTQYQFGDEFVTTYRPNAYIANIKWEETTTYNAGLDFSVVRDRLSGSLDVYQRNTVDLLNYIPLPALSNLSNYATDNIGTMRTRGAELSLNTTPVATSKIKWDFAVNGAINFSEITKLTTSDDPTYKGEPTGGIAGGVGSNIQIHSVGFAPASFYVRQQLYDSLGNVLEGQFADLNGDSLFNDDDKYRFHNPAPRYTIGITSNLTVGKFDFSFAGRAHFGNWAYNNVQTDMGYLDRLFHSSLYLSNVHQSAVDLKVKKQSNLTFSDHFVTNASFFRLDHVTAGYSFSVKKAALRVYATVQNPLVVTQYKGLDPEIGNGIDNNTYPRPKTYLVGASVNF